MAMEKCIICLRFPELQPHQRTRLVSYFGHFKIWNFVNKIAKKVTLKLNGAFCQDHMFYIKFTNNVLSRLKKYLREQEEDSRDMAY